MLSKTLDPYYALPHRQLLNLSSRPVDALRVSSTLARKAAESSYKNGSAPLPATEAVTFYLLNQMMSEILRKYTRYEPLPQELQNVVTAYNQTVVEQSTRLVNYMMLITLREARHYGDKSPAWWDTFKTAHNPIAAQYLRTSGGGAEGVLSAWGNSNLQPMTDVTVGEFYRCVHDLFWYNSFGSSYGGPNWGRVAAPLLDMLHGRISLEMLVDIGYTLAHNGGPIFNKGMLYGSSNSELIFSALNHQRSGMLLPAFHKWGNTASNYYAHSNLPEVSESLLGLIKGFAQHFTIDEYSSGDVLKAAGQAEKLMLKVKTENHEWLAHKNKVKQKAAVEDEVVESTKGLPAGVKFLGLYKVAPHQTASKYQYKPGMRGTSAVSEEEQTKTAEDAAATVISQANDSIAALAKQIGLFGHQADTAKQSCQTLLDELKDHA